MSIVGLCGSLRAGSYNRMLLKFLAASSPAGTGVELHDLRGIPVYDGDLETRDFPEAVATLKDQLAACDGLILATPEYNHGVPGPLKNAIDWCSRPPADIARVYRGRKVGLVGASGGPGATRQAQTAWLPTLRTLGCVVFPEGLFVATAGQVFDADGQVTDPKIAERGRAWIAGFVRFVGS